MTDFNCSNLNTNNIKGKDGTVSKHSGECKGSSR